MQSCWQMTKLGESSLTASKETEICMKIRRFQTLFQWNQTPRHHQRHFLWPLSVIHVSESCKSAQVTKCIRHSFLLKVSLQCQENGKTKNDQATVNWSQIYSTIPGFLTFGHYIKNTRMYHTNGKMARLCSSPKTLETMFPSSQCPPNYGTSCHRHLLC